jgi:alkylation response protein AidB-like acyl-CoA dehydrogenase
MTASVAEHEARPAPVSVDEVRSSVARLCTLLDERAEVLARARRLSDDLFELAARAGLFRQLIPVDLGGVDATPLDWFRTGLEIARHDASVSWVVTQGAAELGWIGAGGDPAWAAEVLADPMGTSASTIAGAGTLTPNGDIARLGGRWGFNTGCHHATWIGGLAVVLGPDGPADPPEMRFGWVPADRAEILDDWDPSGLVGTGSNSTVIPEQDVPMAWTLSTSVPTSNDRGPHRCVVGNGNWPIAVSVAAVQLGASRRALDELRQLLSTRNHKIDQQPLAADHGVQVELMDAEGQWQAARALVERELDSMWEQALEREELDIDQRVRLKLACTNANRAAMSVASTAMQLANTATIDPDLPLSRCVRDIQALQGHIGVGRATLELAAQMSLGIATVPDPLV